MKIIVKITLAFLVTSILVVIVGYMSSNKSQEILMDAIRENSTAIIRTLMDRIDKNIYLLVNQAKLYAYEMAHEEEIIRSNKQFESMEDPEGYVLKMNEEWVSAPKGKLTPLIRGVMDNSLSRRLGYALGLEEFEKQYGYKIYHEIIVTNKYGGNVAVTGRASDYKQDDEKWWQIAKRDGIYVEDVQYDMSSERYGVSVNSRIDDDDGEFLGVMKFLVDMRFIVDDLAYFTTKLGGKSGENAGYSGYKMLEINLMTKDCRMLYSTAMYNIFEKYVCEYLLDPVREKLPDTFYETRVQEEGGGKEVLAVYAFSRGYKDYKGLGWILVMQLDMEEVFAPVVKLRKQLLAISLVAAILSILLGLLVARSIFNPISKLKDATIEIGKGNMNTAIDIKTRDEIEDLARSFQEMVYSIKDKQDQLMVAKSELEKWSQTLEERVEEKTKEVREIQNQLLQAEKLEAIGRMASGVAHEVKNPLSIILQAVNFFEMNLPKEKKELHDVLLMMKDNIARAHEIIRSLGDFSKSQALSLKAEDINSIIDNSLTLILHRTRLENIEVAKEYGENLPKVLADKVKIEQVLINIFINAIQAMPKGGRIKIRTYPGEVVRKKFVLDEKPRYDSGLIDGDEAVFVEVQDNGVGMPEAVLSKIFDPFFTTKAQKDGTGLGLTVTKSIMEMHQGLIAVKSEKGKGTVVTLALREA